MIVEWESQAEREKWGTYLEDAPDVVSEVWNGLDETLRRVLARHFYEDVGFSPQMTGKWVSCSTSGVCQIKFEVKVDPGNGDGVVLYIRKVKAVVPDSFLST